jgi:hypothetical protein
MKFTAENARDTQVVRGMIIPSPGASAIWESIMSRVKNPEFNTVATMDSIDAAVDTRLMSIDYGFDVHSNEIVNKINSFRHWHAESLLDQAADLLDRGLREQSELDELAVRAFTTGQDLLEFAKSDLVHQDEINSGRYEIPYQDSLAEYNSLVESANKNKNIADYLRSVVSPHYEGPIAERFKNQSQRFAYFSGQPPFREDHDRGGDWRLTTPKVPWNTSWSGDGDKESLTHQIEAVGEQTSHGLLSQSYNVQTACMEKDSQSITALKRLEGLSKQKDWNFANVEFAMRRVAIAREIASQKAKAFTEPGGALNYASRIEPIRTRCAHDLQEAVARMLAAHKGLTEIYNYSELLPTTSDLPSPTSGRILTDCVLRVRKAISFIVRLSSSEQIYVMPLSVKSLVDSTHGEGTWTSVLNDAVMTNEAYATWSFRLTPEQFHNQSVVRLRGVTGYVVGASVDDVWAFAIRVPERGYYQSLSKSSRIVDQSAVPEVIAGRVYSRSSVRSPDVVG